MKKLLILVFCAILALTLAACGKSAEKASESALGGQNAQIQNPFVDCKTLDEAETLAGFDIALPAKMPEGYTMSAIRAIKDTMIEIIYTNGDNEIRIRKGTGSEDISGDYSDYSETETVTLGDLQVTMKGNDEKVNVATWADGGHVFSVTINPGEEGIAKTAVSDIVSNVQ